MLSRKTWSTIGTVAAFAIVVALLLWTRSGDATTTSAADPGTAPATSGSPATSNSPTADSGSGAGASTSWSGDPSDSAYDEPTEDPARSDQQQIDPDSGLAWVEAVELPEEAVETLELIEAGGPFPYPGKDGSTFGNYEGILPGYKRGYYAEYTVPTPGSSDRGARRIIVGDGGEFYWTADHYDSFERIRR